MLEVSLNGEHVDGNSDNQGVVAETINMSITITNTSTASLPPLHLRITTFQDHQNGHHNYRLETKMTTTGAIKLLTSQVIYKFKH